MTARFFSAAALLLALVLAANAARGASAQHSPMLHVIEHALTDTVVDLGPKGDSLGDELAFGNPIYNAANTKVVGRDQGNCVRTTVHKYWECYWTVLLPGGQITVEGPYHDDGSDSVLAVTGGTGSYIGARGQMTLHARDAKGSAYDFLYDLR